MLLNRLGGVFTAAFNEATKRRCACGSGVLLVWIFGHGTDHMTFLGSNKDEAAAISELYGNDSKPPTSDRAAAIIAGSLLETTLTRTLVAHLHTHRKVTEDLFKVSGALGYFGTKINLGFLIGMYGEPFRKELDTIKEIRNDFAHKLSVHDFKTDRINGLTKNLKILEQYVFGPGIDVWTGAPGWTGTQFTLPSLGPPIRIHVADRDVALSDSRQRFIMATAVLARLLSSLFDDSGPTLPPVPRI
jgi:hypothetical protein